ncbi:melanin-concentrating hormone receptor 2 isoform X3 [Paroedura picta]|uniref:melanin-concentrating hormone receptor 2 isoform X3 n=1 Tax=Paroedura picta TaxID=143630 RepID=UPI004056F2ED
MDAGRPRSLMKKCHMTRGSACKGELTHSSLAILFSSLFSLYHETPLIPALPPSNPHFRDLRMLGKVGKDPYLSRKKTIPDIYICNLAVADLVHIIGMPFLIHQWARGGEWVFGNPLCTIITSLDTCNQFACSAIMTVMSLDRYTLYLTMATFFFPLPLILVCYFLILCYTWELYQQNEKSGCYNTNIPRQRVMKLTKMVLVLVGVFVLSAAPYHVIQLVNLQIAQPTPTFYISYYFTICLSYASGSINPFLYIMLSGNFQKRLRQCIHIRTKTVDREFNNIENTLT